MVALPRRIPDAAIEPAAAPMWWTSIPEAIYERYLVCGPDGRAARSPKAATTSRSSCATAVGSHADYYARDGRLPMASAALVPGLLAARAERPDRR